MLVRSVFWNIAAATFIIWTVGVLLVQVLSGGDASASSDLTFLLSLASGVAAGLLARGWLDGLAIVVGFFLSVALLALEGAYKLDQIEAPTLLGAWLVFNLSALFFFVVTYWLRRALGRRLQV